MDYFAGIDVSKDSFCIAIKNESFVIKNRLFGMDRAGFTDLETTIRSFKQNMIIGMEATGTYHLNLLNFLHNKGYHTRVVNPYKVNQFAKFNNNKPTKTDKKDAKTIAEFVELTEKDPSPLVDGEYGIRYFVRENEKRTQEIAKTKTEIRRMLNIVFPEIENTPSAISKKVLSILNIFPSADRIRRTTKEKFIQKTIRTGKGRKISLSIDHIYELACSSIAYSYPVYEKLLKIKIKRLFELMKEKDRISLIIEEQATKIFKKEIDVLTSIKGIGIESAIYFISEMVSIKRFSGWRKLIGFCGLDPIIKQSGNYKGAFRISKRGNSHARRIVWIMATCVSRSCPYFREYYLMKREQGKCYKEAVIATSTKLLRTIYALLNEERRFE